MNKTLLIFLLLCTPNLIHANPVRDAELTRNLIGTWNAPAGSFKPRSTNIVKSNEKVFMADGTFTELTIVQTKDQEVQIRSSGTWKIDTGVLIETVTKSNQEKLVPTPYTTKQIIIEITDKELHYHAESNKEGVKVRIRKL
jgi:hypothetical protein